MEKKNKRIPIRSLIVAVIVLSAAVYFIKICFDGLSGNFVEDGWGVASGTILDPDLTLTGKKNIERKNQGFEQTINYEYTIDGVKYESNSVSREIYLNQADFPRGKVVDVYYNPTNPTETILVRTKVQKHYLYGIMGFSLVIIFVTFYSLKKDFENH